MGTLLLAHQRRYGRCANSSRLESAARLSDTPDLAGWIWRACGLLARGAERHRHQPRAVVHLVMVSRHAQGSDSSSMSTWYRSRYSPSSFPSIASATRSGACSLGDQPASGRPLSGGSGSLDSGPGC